LTVIGSPFSEENSFFVPERGPVLRSWLSQEEEDRKQNSGSDSEMIALGYLENIASRHAELVSKYCSQGFSNLQHLPATSVLQDQILNRIPQTGAPNRSPEQVHIRAGSLGQAFMAGSTG